MAENYELQSTHLQSPEELLQRIAYLREDIQDMRQEMRLKIGDIRRETQDVRREMRQEFQEIRRGSSGAYSRSVDTNQDARNWPFRLLLGTMIAMTGVILAALKL